MKSVDILKSGKWDQKQINTKSKVFSIVSAWVALSGNAALIDTL